MEDGFKSVMSKFVWVFVIAFVAFVWYSVDATKRLYKLKLKSDALETTISDMGQKMRTFEIQMDDSTRLHAATVKNLRMTVENIQAKYDKLLDASSIKPKDVNHFTTVTTVVNDTVYVPVEVDSFGGLQTGYKDKFIDISVDISPEKMATIGYASRDSLSLIITQKKHSLLFGLIKWKSLEKTTVINHNPKATISSLETINVIE